MTGFQTVCLFASGYLVSRLVLRADAHLVFVEWLVGRSRGRVSRVVLGVMLAAFLLSTIVPNALTVLALIPVITRLRAWAGDAGEGAGFASLLAMGLIYGANLGGVGSLLGSPANLYLLLNLNLYAVPGRESLHFVSWLVFGLPMALLLLLLCWGLLHLTERSAMATTLPLRELEPATRGPLYRRAVRWTWLWALGWAVFLAGSLSLGGGGARGNAPIMLLGRWPLTGWDLGALALALLFTAALFVWPVQTAAGRERLLRPRDLWREVPLRGIALGVGVLILLVVIAKSGAVDALRHSLPQLLPTGGGRFVVTLVLILIAIFATEVLNNTTVSTVLFPAVASLAHGLGADPLLLMLGVSLASTCAFMTPVATPVNALAFAGIGGVSLRTFLKNGLLVNLLAAVWITAWLTWLIPPVLTLFSP